MVDTKVTYVLVCYSEPRGPWGAILRTNNEKRVRGLHCCLIAFASCFFEVLELKCSITDVDAIEAAVAKHPPPLNSLARQIEPEYWEAPDA